MRILWIVLLTMNVLLGAVGGIGYQYAVYLPNSLEDNVTVEKARQLSQQYLKGFDIVAEIDRKSDKPQVMISLIDTRKAHYLPPDKESLGYFGRGITSEDVAVLGANEQAIILDVRYPEQYIYSGLYDFSIFTLEVGKAYRGLIWDEETREVFGYDKWKEQRIESYSAEKIPDVTKQITIHAYKNSDYIRAITLGMKKFGREDIVVNDFAWSNNSSVGNLINLIAQQIVETRSGETALKMIANIDAIKHPVVKGYYKNILYENASKGIAVTLKPTKNEEGDPDNRLLEVDFDTLDGKSLQARQEQLLASLFGFEDKISYVKHNDEILKKSEEAKAKLPGYKEKFNKGFKPGEYLLLKAPFPVGDDTNEWMWVEVHEWKGTQITGLLKNDPYNIPALKAGMTVTVDQNDIFDYIHYLPDGTSVGNETAKLIEKYQTR